MAKKKSIIPLIAATGILFLISKGVAAGPVTVPKSSSGDRGLRNKNPGNIRKSDERFNGEVRPSTDLSFKQFISMPYGYRAMFKLIQNYLYGGFDTIRKIISRWSPPNENDTEAHIKYVSTRAGKGPDEKVGYFDPSTIIKIVKGISRVENGVDAVDRDVSDGYNLWLNE